MRGPQHEFCAKMKFPAQKNKNTSVNGTTSLAVIVGPKCLIAHLLAPHDRAFSRRKVIIHYGVFLSIQLYNRGGLAEFSLASM